MITTKDLNEAQRNLIAEKLMEWANYVFLGLVITRVFLNISDFLTAGMAAVVFIGTYLFAYRIMKGGGKV